MVDTDLAAYKSAFASAEQEKAQLQALLDQREERIHSLEIQLRVSKASPWCPVERVYFSIAHLRATASQL